MKKDNALNINLCVTCVIPFIFTCIQTMKIGVFYNSNGVSFMDRWFIYDVKGHCIAPR